ncbi:MAG TPA: tRNA (adenosine(37)-N6)-dimethylallyltransferase MiaA [Coriobacteriia bacterium]|jgi:tRNA dimethylallyltransferase
MTSHTVPELVPERAPARGRVLAVVGPTAVGKTTVAEELAVRLGGEIVSADSMQVYRGMDVGTAKPRPYERRVPYRCLDLVDPGTPYSAALYQRDARAAIGDIQAEGKLPVVCGGTGLYVRATLDDMRFPPGEAATASRERYERIAESDGAEVLHALLAQRDPASAALIHPNNVRRVVRALEMLDAGGMSYAEQAAGSSSRASVYDAFLLGLAMERAELYARIEARVDAMMTAGLLAEVDRLLDAGYRDALTASQAIGYKELVPVLEEGADLGEAVEAVKRATRRYAKRQLTWFNADPRVTWLDVTELSPSATADEAQRLVESALHLREGE